MSDTITIFYNEDVFDEDGPLNTVSDMELNFSDLLDDTNDDVTILGYTYSPSEVLAKVDPITYRESFLAYCGSWDSIEVPLDLYFSEDDDAVRRYITDSL